MLISEIMIKPVKFCVKPVELKKVSEPFLLLVLRSMKEAISKKLLIYWKKLFLTVKILIFIINW